MSHFPTDLAYFSLGNIIFLVEAGRPISDNIIIYQEVLHSLRIKKGKEGDMMCKIDQEKAYDNVSWDFIHNTLKEVGLSTYWISNIMKCIQSFRIEIIWNGEKLQSFNPDSGLRQGNLMFTYIFVLCMERFSHMVFNATMRGQCKGIKVSRSCSILSHLLFADDMVPFDEASLAQMQVMFGAVSGQKINFHVTYLFFTKCFKRLGEPDIEYIRYSPNK